MALYEEDNSNKFKTEYHYFSIYADEKFQGSVAYVFGQNRLRSKFLYEKTPEDNPNLSWKERARASQIKEADISMYK